MIQWRLIVDSILTFRMSNLGKQLVASKQRVSALIVGAGVFLALVVVLLGSNANADNGSGVQPIDSTVAKVSTPAMIKPKAMKKPKKKTTPTPAPASSPTPAPVASSPAPTPQKKSSPQPRYEAPGVLR